MRDPTRIDPLLDLIRRIMHANPDLRLGQIISIVSEQPFYLEDDILMARLWERFKPTDPAPKRRNCWTCKYCDGPVCNYGEENDYKSEVAVLQWLKTQRLEPVTLLPPRDSDGCPGWEMKP